MSFVGTSGTLLLFNPLPTIAAYVLIEEVSTYMMHICVISSVVYCNVFTFQLWFSYSTHSPSPQ